MTGHAVRFAVITPWTVTLPVVAGSATKASSDKYAPQNTRNANFIRDFAPFAASVTAPTKQWMPRGIRPDDWISSDQSAAELLTWFAKFQCVNRTSKSTEVALCVITLFWMFWFGWQPWVVIELPSWNDVLPIVAGGDVFENSRLAGLP